LAAEAWTIHACSMSPFLGVDGGGPFFTPPSHRDRGLLRISHTCGHRLIRTTVIVMQRQCCDVGASRAKPEPPGQMPGGFFRSTSTALPVSVPGG
jgi:hypothetical protein